MLDGDGQIPDKERIKEEIKFEISQLFDVLFLEISDATLKGQLAQQKKIATDLLSQAKEMETLPEEVMKELSRYSEIFEKATDRIKDSNEFTAAQIKVAVANAGIHYDSGRINSALELLDDPESGAIVYAENVADWSEELGQIYSKIRRLIDLISQLSK